MNKAIRPAIFNIRYIFCFILCAIIVYRFIIWPTDDSSLRHYAGESITGDVWVVGEPEEKNGSQRFIAEIEKIDGTNFDKNDEDKNNKSHLAQVSIPNSSAIKYGDKLELTGKLQNISAGGSSYGQYMRVRKVFYQVNYGTATIKGNQSPSRLMSFLINIKNIFVTNINNQLPAPESFLATGLLLTGKGSLDNELQNDFKRVGLIHIVVLSGFNVSIVAVVIMSLLKFLPPIVRFVIGAFFMTCFCLMVGGGASVMRSLVMNMISIYGKTMGLNYKPIKGLFIAGLLMLVFNPLLLFYDPSFQMSFMATLGLVLLSDKIANWLTFLTEKFGVRETISATLSTQIAVTPLIMHLSGVVSLISPLTNILVLPLIPYTMLFVVFQELSSYINNILVKLTSFVSFVLLSYELKVVKVFSALPFSAIEFSAWGWTQSIICYFLMAAIYLFVHYKSKKKILKIVCKGVTRKNETSINRES